MVKIINEAKALPKRFTPAVEMAITGHAKATEAYELKSVTAIDTLRAAGIMSSDFISPKKEGSTATPELNAAFKAAIIKGLSAAKRKLLDAPAKSLSDEDKEARRGVQQSIGAYMGAFKRDLLAREPEGIAKAKAKKEAGRAAQQSTGQAKAAGSAAKVLESLQQAAKRARAIEEPEFDVVALVDLLAKAQQIVVRTEAHTRRIKEAQLPTLESLHQAAKEAQSIDELAVISKTIGKVKARGPRK